MIGRKEGGSENKYSEIYRTGYFYQLARKKRKKIIISGVRRVVKYIHHLYTLER